MYSIYRLNASELDERFVESIKALFRGKELEIIIAEIEDASSEKQLENPIVAEVEVSENLKNKRSVIESLEAEEIRRFV
jgi:antitoxin YefM